MPNFDVMQAITQFGAVAVAFLLFRMWWRERKDQQERERKEAERERGERDTIIGQLQGIIKDDIVTREKMVEVITMLSTSTNNFHSSCSNVQVAFADTQRKIESSADRLGLIVIRLEKLP